MDIRCLCCSPETIEKKQSSRTYAIEETLPKRQKLSSDEYLCCSLCSSKVCFSCSEKLCAKIEEKKNLLTDRSLSFFYSMKSFVERRVYDKKTFVGHCCLIKSVRKFQRAAEDAKKKVSSNKEIDISKSIGGDLYLYEYNLLIDSPTNGDVDIHALGAESTLSALWHCVIRNDRGEDLLLKNLHPSAKKINRLTKTVEIGLPFAPARKKKVCYCFSLFIFYL